MKSQYKWRRLADRNEVKDVAKYIMNYLANKPNTQVYVGTDSQVHRNQAMFVTCIVLHDNHVGGHVLYTRTFENPRIDSIMRLFHETVLSLQVAEELKEANITVDFIDLDLNPDEEYLSNKVLRQAVGMITSSGYQARHKRESNYSCSIADKLCRK